MYTREEFIKDCLKLFEEAEGIIVDIPGRERIFIFDSPLIGFASASDDLFDRFKRVEAIGENFRKPSEWLPGAKTVVSFFLPYSEAIRISNREGRTEPSIEWLYGRIEGQEFISKLMASLKRFLEAKHIGVIVPALEPDFNVKYETIPGTESPDFHADSRWSERHAAYACGLGTFGLSRGLISEKGMAGRYASLIVSEEWEATGRSYTGLEDYCIRCGVCAKNCPAGAITLECGKNNALCSDYLDKMKEKYSPRYGCGKCQVGVPCECRAPGRSRGGNMP